MRTPLAVALLLAFALPSFAGPREQLRELYQATSASKRPNLTFFSGLAKMADFQLGPADMREVEEGAQLPPGSIMAAFLTGIETMRKSGERITLTRATGTSVRAPGGFVKLSDQVEFRVRVLSEAEVKIDKVDGARVGRTANSTHPLRYVLFERKGTQSWAHINAGYGIFSQTASVLVYDSAVEEAAGIAQALPN